jgi:hypothetical protein
MTLPSMGLSGGTPDGAQACGQVGGVGAPGRRPGLQAGQRGRAGRRLPVAADGRHRQGADPGHQHHGHDHHDAQPAAPGASAPERPGVPAPPPGAAGGACRAFMTSASWSATWRGCAPRGCPAPRAWSRGGCREITAIPPAGPRRDPRDRLGAIDRPPKATQQEVTLDAAIDPPAGLGALIAGLYTVLSPIWVSTAASATPSGR